jgi:hypothetical protein
MKLEISVLICVQTTLKINSMHLSIPFQQSPRIIIDLMPPCYSLLNTVLRQPLLPCYTRINHIPIIVLHSIIFRVITTSSILHATFMLRTNLFC